MILFYSTIVIIDIVKYLFMFTWYGERFDGSLPLDLNGLMCGTYYITYLMHLDFLDSIFGHFYSNMLSTFWINNIHTVKYLQVNMCWRAIKILIFCHVMDGRLKNPNAIKVVCGFMPVSNTYLSIGLIIEFNTILLI